MKRKTRNLKPRVRNVRKAASRDLQMSLARHDLQAAAYYRAHGFYRMALDCLIEARKHTNMANTAFNPAR